VSLVSAVLFWPVLIVGTGSVLRERLPIPTLALLCSLPVVAIAFGFAARRRRARAPAATTQRAGVGLVLGTLELGLVLFAAFVLPDSGHTGHPANRTRCLQNLWQLGQAVLLYSNENHGLFPPNIDALVLTQDVRFEQLVCPSTTDTPAPGPTMQAALRNLHAQPGHCSYTYVGRGLTNRTATAEHVVAYEPISNHGGAGISVLFGDGHTLFLFPADAKYVLLELQAGHNPPRPRAGAANAPSRG
jgi:hypothetical protein